MSGILASRAQALELAKSRLRNGEDLTPALRLVVLEALRRVVPPALVTDPRKCMDCSCGDRT